VIALEWTEIEALALGRLEGAPADGRIVRVHADSRVAVPGDLFVALNTGVRHVDDALARGAAALVPDDQHRALAELARLVRDRSQARVVAVVGSVGKTTTKDALGALCAAVTPTVYAEASLNNEIGLPLTVLRLEPETRVLVLEMGMRGLGQVAELCAVARPDVAVVTAIGPEHLELVGTVDDVARANAEAIEALPAGGTAVVPADAPELEPYLARDDLRLVRVDAAGVERIGPGATDPALIRWRFRLGGVGREVELDLPFAQRHLAANVLTALTTYDALGLPLEQAQEGASLIRLSRWRGETAALPGDGLVVNDAYNANPLSMRAALRDLVERAGARRRVAILGEMAELGEQSERHHREIGALLAGLPFDVLVAVGEPARAYMEPGVQEMHWLPDAGAFPEADGVVQPGDAILVKASRAVGLEGIPAQIENIAAAWSES
jgi:UDP-N-acetylmuramoyl-tripeptide--D-alanyl-D-alanine ligase